MCQSYHTTDQAGKSWYERQHTPNAESYLSNHKIVVEIDGEGSKENLIDIEIGQGTIIEPLLYLIYINDIGSRHIGGEANMLYRGICDMQI